MKKHIYTAEEEQWISEYAEKLTAEELKNAFNVEFDADVTFHSILQKRQRMGISKGTSPRVYTEEEEKFLRENRDAMPMVKLHEQFCKVFSYVNYYALRAKVQRMGLRVDKPEKFNNIKERSEVPIGSEHTYNGYIMVKVSDEYVGKSKSHEAYRKNWRYKQHIEYEKYNGKLPDKHQVIFLDGDKQNFSKDNLMAVPIKYMPMMNRNGWINGNPEITKTAVKLCELFYTIHDI